MLVPQAQSRVVRVAAVTAIALGAWWMVAPRAGMPPVSPVGDQPVYLIVDEPRLPLVEPVLRAPWISSSALLRGWTVMLVVTAAAVAAQAAGAGALAALAATLALVMDAAFAASVAHGGGLARAAGLIWVLAAAQGARWWQPRTTWLAVVVAVAWGAATWSHWLALCAGPMALAAVWRVPSRRGRMVGTLGVALAGSVGAVAGFASVASASLDLGSAPGVSLGVRDVLAVAFESRPRLPAQAFVAPDLVVGGGSRLALVLAAVGLLTGQFARGTRRAGVATLLAALVVVVLWPEWEAEATRLARWLVLPLAGIGLTWASGQVGTAGRVRMAAAVLGGVLVIEAWVAGVRPLGGTEAREFRDRFVTALDGHVGGTPAVWVAEDTRIDSAVAAWLDGVRWRRVPQGRSFVDAARAEGWSVLAGPTGRRHLELAGLTFREVFTLREPIPFMVSAVDGAYRCVTVTPDLWSQLPGVEYTGRLGVQLPAGLGEMWLVVGDDLPLRLRASTAEGRDMPLATEPLMRGPGHAAPPPDFWMDGGQPGDGPREVVRVRLPADPARGTLVSLHLGRRAPRVIARLAGAEATARAVICAAPVGEPLLAGAAVHELDLADEARLGVGWHGYERVGAERFRWTEAEAVLLVTARSREKVTVDVDAEPAVVDMSPRIVDARRQSGTTLTLRVNGVDLGPRSMDVGRATYSWEIPAGTWVAGTNELWWSVSRAVRPSDEGGAERRRLGMRVSGVRVRR